MRSYVWWIAIRQVFFSQKKAGLLFMTFASMMGVMIGIAALIVTLSVMGGFERELRAKLFMGIPHLEVFSKPMGLGFSMKKYPLAYFHKTFPQAESISPFVRSEVILKHDQHLVAVRLFGIDPSTSRGIWGFHEVVGAEVSLAEGLADGGDLPSLMVGADLAGMLGVGVGDTVNVLSSQGTLSGFLSGQRWFHAFRVAGVFHTGQEEYDGRYAVTSLAEARRYMQDYDSFLDAEEYISGIAMIFGHEDDVDGVVPEVLSQEFEVLSWKQVNRSLLFALMLEKLAMGTVLFLIIIVAAFSLSGTVMMMVYYKKRQISLLRGLGMPWQDIVRIFVAHGMVIGVVGVVVGCVVGLLLCVVIEDVGVISLPRGVFALQKLPVQFLYFDYVIISVFALALTVLASVYPAYIAGKQDPGEGLR